MINDFFVHPKYINDWSMFIFFWFFSVFIKIYYIMVLFLVDIFSSCYGYFMANLDSIFKSRDITLPTKVHLVKAMVFPVVMYGHESCPVKKAERWRIDAFELWCWRRLLKSPLDCKEIQPVHCKGDQSWVFFGKTDAKAETPILWPSYKELTHWKRLWC